MCGIYGIYNFDNQRVDKEQLTGVANILEHRGPDSKGILVDRNIALGAVRLKIIDLSGKGNQPLFSRDKSFCIVYNGEIYNFRELRKQLESKYKFSSDTDTEVVLYAFLEWGQDCLDKFNGMFALAIFDIKNRKLFLARDRFGIKPLYYYRDNQRFIFSSELKTFKYMLKTITINEEAVYNYLVFNRTDYDSNTFYKDLQRLPSGHKISIQDNQFYLNKWYDLENNLKEAYKHPQELKKNLASSLCLRLRSDVPVGVCLSGGLDSSSLVSLLINELGIENIQTFSAVFGKDKFGDESAYIDEFKPAIGENMHKVCLISKDMLSDLTDFIYYLDEPVPQIAPFIHYQVMKLAKQKVVVLLDGQGADEQFAGYHYLFGFFFKELLYKKNITRLSKEIAYYLLKHQSLFGLKSFLYFLLPAKTQTNLRIFENKSLSKDFLFEFRNQQKIPQLLYQANDLQTSLIKHFKYKLEHLLKWEDRNSMRFSLESRLPFLDHRIVERTLSLPSSFIISNGQTKIILREAMQDILPEKIRSRQDKLGFNSPCAEWFREEKFKHLIFDILHSKSFQELVYFNFKHCLKVYQRHLDKKLDASSQIWKWINLELWHRKFFQ